MFTAKEFKCRVQSSVENTIQAMEMFIDHALKTAADHGVTKNIVVVVPYNREHLTILDNLIGKYAKQGGYSILLKATEHYGDNQSNTYHFDIKE